MIKSLLSLALIFGFSQAAFAGHHEEKPKMEKAAKEKIAEKKTEAEAAADKGKEKADKMTQEAKAKAEEAKKTK